MRTMRKLGSVVIVTAVVAALELGGAHAANSNNPSYQSSITAGDSGDGERAEVARYMELAKIDAGKAMAAAQARVPGKVLSAALDNENGNLFYSVVITPQQAGLRRTSRSMLGTGPCSISTRTMAIAIKTEV